MHKSSEVYQMIKIEGIIKEWWDAHYSDIDELLNESGTRAILHADGSDSTYTLICYPVIVVITSALVSISIPCETRDLPISLRHNEYTRLIRGI
mgnify:CR=1 FL=1